MDSVKYVAKYSGPNRSGVCVCGHSWEDHHLGVVMNEEYLKQTNEAYYPQECEYDGFNEMANCCSMYKDSKE